MKYLKLSFDFEMYIYIYIYTDNFVSSLYIISVLRMAHDISTNDIYDLFVVSKTCLVHHLLMVLKSDTVISISEFPILYLNFTIFFHFFI